MLAQETSPLILIIDDQELIRILLQQMLGKQGYRTVAAANGPEGLALLERHPVDLVVLDVMMPGMDGVQVLQQIKQNPATTDLPVLMVSADSDTGRIASCIDIGAADYLVKPFNTVIVRARVNSCLEQSRLRAKERAYQALLEQQVAERTALAAQRAQQLERSEAELRRQSNILQSILNCMGDGVVVVDINGKLVHRNPAAIHILGEHFQGLLPRSQSPADKPHDPLAPGDSLNEPLPLVNSGYTVDSVEVFAPSVDGHGERWLSITARPLHEEDGPVTGAVAVVRDVSQAKQAELALRESEARYALAARGANDGLWDWDVRESRVHYSPRWKAMLGYSDEEIGTTPAEWFERVHPDDREPTEARLIAHHHGLTTHFEQEYRIRHHNGHYRWMLCRGLAVWDDDGRVVRMAGSQTDITDRKQFEQQLVHHALHDTLTGLPNRVLFVDRLDQAIRRASRNPAYRFSVLFLDVDRFKVINDSLGHTIGDQMLVALGKRLRECLRPSDTVARLGGDEFTVLLEEIDQEQDTLDVAERIQQVLAAPLQLENQSISASASIGILHGSTEYTSATDVIRDADTAMSHAKMAGKARAVVFNSAMHAQAMLQLYLGSELRWAIERDELRVHYQPIVDLKTQRIMGMEALVRWQHPQRGLLYPATFLSIAEETGLIAPISWWVLRTACAQLQSWQKQLPHRSGLWVSVNLCAQQLSQPDFLEAIQAVLAETALSPQSLKLEITEHTLVEFGDPVLRAIAQIRALGVQMCIDDFGTGYSSLSYLQVLPVDVLKIDRSFIERMGAHADRSEIVQSIISLAQTLGIKVVAEGTETTYQADTLRRLDCDFGQGWLFSKAVSAPDVEALLRAQ